MTQIKDLFTEAKKVIASFKEKDAQLDKQEQELHAELAVLQEEMTNNILATEEATVTELVYLKIQSKDIIQKTEIIKVLLEELEEERTALKLEFAPQYSRVLGQAKTHEYNATKIAEKYKYQMLKEIADIGKQMQTQYFEIAPDIDEVIKDSKVLGQYPRFAYAYNYDNYKPSFSWFDKAVVSKNEVLSATGGHIPEGVKEPQEQDVK
ncbi:hypothetical protein [Priestia megaterium]|uniref:hypothetical protein n=1 Tax=Priestia megaterium TaxID=1404 RepID=UPI0011B5CA1D|nr:hypothetical protein [Priestia megaterium]QDZ88740.1 hypothetical protein D0441_31410 [Priestia megaterium]